MKTSKKGLDLIKEFEGCKLSAYKDQGGIYTIGWGATGEGVNPNSVWTQQQADERLIKDLEDAEWGVGGLVQTKISQNQFDALVCFAYNVGIAALARSSLLKQLNMKHFKEAAEQFLNWCHVKGAVNAGLLRRRQAEKKLFLS